MTHKAHDPPQPHGAAVEIREGAAPAPAPTARAVPSERLDNPGAEATRRYLRQFDLFRVVAFLGVIAQHSVLWPVPGGSITGWAFVMVLHATREVFFFLSALLAVYTQLAQPRPLPQLWYRRITQILVPYLAWTAIYFVYTLATSSLSASGALSTLGHDLVTGYYQLYFLIVLLQIYVLLPGIVWLVRRTRGHHGWVFGISLALQLAMMTVSHYFSWRTGVLGDIRGVDLTLISSRFVVGYQLYVVAGALAADHVGELQQLVERNYRRILRVVLAIGLATEGYYFVGIAQGETPGHASDLYQPVAAVWFLAACAGLTALGHAWARRAAKRSPTRFDRLVTWGSDASGGFYLAHVLVLQLIFSGLTAAGLMAHAVWGAGAIVLYVTTLAGTAILVAILLRTPLRFVLTGPNRSDQRARLEWYPPSVGLRREMTRLEMAEAPAQLLAD